MLGTTLDLDAPVAETKDVIEYLHERQCLLLFDNAEGVLWQDRDAVHDIINAILKFATHISLLITSQRLVGGNLHEPERLRRVYPMDQDSAALLFLATTKRRMSGEEWISNTFQDILGQLGGHPLSINHMARQLVPGVTVEDLMDRIRRYKAKAITVRNITDRDLEHGESLVASIASAYDNVSEKAKTLFGILSMLPAGAQEFTLKQILGAMAWDHAQELNDASLVEITDYRRVILLPPVRLFAISVLKDEVKEQYGSEIVELMGQYAKQFYEHFGAKDAKKHHFFFTMEEPNLRFAVELPCSPPKTNKDPSALGLLAPHLLSLYNLQYRFHEAKEVGDVVIANLKKLQDLPGEANTLKALGDLSMRTDDLGAAKESYKKALDIFQQIDEKLGEANTLMRLGQWFALADELDYAESNLAGAYTIFREIGDLEGQADVQMGRVLVLLKRHNDAKAREELNQSSSIRDKVCAHGEAAQWLIFYADHLKLKGFDGGARICLEYAGKFASKAQDPRLQNLIKQRLSEHTR